MSRYGKAKFTEAMLTEHALRASRWGSNVTINSVPIPQPFQRVEARRAKPAPVFPGLCVAAGLPRPECEFQFHPLRRWRFDYAFVVPMVAVECDGGLWRKGGGAHSHPLNIERDIEKSNTAVMLGWRILRYAPENLGNAIHDLRIILAKE